MTPPYLRKGERDPNVLLTHYITVKAQEAGIPWDTYHADFLLGLIFEWLDAHDNVLLTSSGVKARRR